MHCVSDRHCRHCQFVCVACNRLACNKFVSGVLCMACNKFVSGLLCMACNKFVSGVLCMCISVLCVYCMSASQGVCRDVRTLSTKKEHWPWQEDHR